MGFSSLQYTSASDPPAGAIGSKIPLVIPTTSLTSGAIVNLGAIALPVNGDYYITGGLNFGTGLLTLSANTQLTTSLSATVINTDLAQGFTNFVNQLSQQILTTRIINTTGGVLIVYILVKATFTLSTLTTTGLFIAERKV